VLAGDPAQAPALLQAQQQKTMEAWRNWAPSALVWRSRANHMAILREPHLAEWAEDLFAHQCSGVTHATSAMTQTSVSKRIEKGLDAALVNELMSPNFQSHV
jgi:hypothetical protein